MFLRIWQTDLFSKHINLRCLLQKVRIFQPETSQLLRGFPSRLRSVDVICVVAGNFESQRRQKRGRKEWEEKEAIYWRGRRWTNVQRKEGKDRLLDGYQVRVMKDFIYPLLTIFFISDLKNFYISFSESASSSISKIRLPQRTRIRKKSRGHRIVLRYGFISEEWGLVIFICQSLT